MAANAMCPKDSTPLFPTKMPIPATRTTLMTVAMASRSPLAPRAAAHPTVKSATGMASSNARMAPDRSAEDHVLDVMC